MKKILNLIVIAIIMASVSCSAQTEKQTNGGRSNESIRQELKDSLKLTDAQADSVISIKDRYQPQIKQVSQDQSLTADAKKEKMKPIKKEMKSELKKILNEEQLAKLQQLESGMRQKKQNGAK